MENTTKIFDLSLANNFCNISFMRDTTSRGSFCNSTILTLHLSLSNINGNFFVGIENLKISSIVVICDFSDFAPTLNLTNPPVKWHLFIIGEFSSMLLKRPTRDDSPLLSYFKRSKYPLYFESESKSFFTM